MAVKPTLHLLALSGLSPEERIRALVALFEQLTGKRPTPEEVERALRTTRATAPAAKSS